MCSLVIVLIMALPGWVSKSANAPVEILAYSKRAVRAGGSMLVKAGDTVAESMAGAVAGTSWRMPPLGLGSSQTCDVAAAAAPQQGAAPALSSQATEPTVLTEKQTASVAAGPSAEDLQLRTAGHASNTPFALYTAIALGWVQARGGVARRWWWGVWRTGGAG